MELKYIKTLTKISTRKNLTNQHHIVVNTQIDSITEAPPPNLYHKQACRSCSIVFYIQLCMGNEKLTIKGENS